MKTYNLITHNMTISITCHESELPRELAFAMNKIGEIWQFDETDKELISEN